jgi:hypothetical protein
MQKPSPQSHPPADKAASAQATRRTRRDRRSRRARKDPVEAAFARAAGAVAKGDRDAAEAWAKAARALEEAERRCGLHRREEARIAARCAEFAAAQEAWRGKVRADWEALHEERMSLARIARALQKKALSSPVHGGGHARSAGEGAI